MRIIVIAEANGSISYEDDREVPGAYPMEIPDGTLNIASCALDTFHDTVPIKNLDEFDIRVEDEDRNVLVEDEEVGSYEHPIRGQIHYHSDYAPLITA